MKRRAIGLFVFALLCFDPLLTQAYAQDTHTFKFRSSSGTVSVNLVRAGMGYKIHVNKKFLDYSIHPDTGTPVFHRLTDTQFAYLGCDLLATGGDPLLECKVWRIGDVSGHKFDIALQGFVREETSPQFLGPLMAFQSLLPNGNVGCEVYDWRQRKRLLHADLGTKPGSRPSWDGPTFSRDGKQVICQISRGWKQTRGDDGDEWKPSGVQRFTQSISP
jgi:hypothetical protein